MIPSFCVSRTSGGALGVGGGEAFAEFVRDDPGDGLFFCSTYAANKCCLLVN